MASNTVVNVLAVVGGIGSGGVACFEAELTTTHEIVPLNGLDVHVGITVGGGESITEEESTERVASLIGTVGVKFTSVIIGGDVNENLVDVSGD